MYDQKDKIDNHILLGDIALRGQTVIHDFQEKQIGFVPRKWYFDDTDSEIFQKFLSF